MKNAMEIPFADDSCAREIGSCLCPRGRIVRKDIVLKIMTRLSVTGILLCAALPALAQNTPAPPVLPTTPAAPAAPGVTPEAKSLLEKMFAAYDATKSLTTLTELEVRGGTGTNSVLITGTVDYKFRAPNLVSARALFESKIGGVGTKPESLVVNDGKLLSIADYTSKS